MKRVSVPDANRPKLRKNHNRTTECDSLNSLCDHLWRSSMEPILSDNPDGAHARPRAAPSQRNRRAQAG